ncbi:MAG: polysaccharide biosynthesis tyrosine autokinase [Myxococcota bacterium]
MNEQPTGDSAAGLSLGDLWAIVQMQRNVVIASVACTMIIALGYSLVATRYYSSSAVLHLSTMAGQELRTDRVVDLDQYHRWNRQIFVQTQIEIIRSRDMRFDVLQAYEALATGDDLRADADGLLRLEEMIEVKVRQGTELVDIAITSSSPEMSARLANLVAETYQAKNLDALTDAAVEAKVWLQEQLRNKEEEIAQASEQLRTFQRDNDMADVEEELTSRSATMDSLNRAIGETRTELAEQEAKVRTYERLFQKGETSQLAKDMNTPLIVALTQDYARAATAQARIAANLGVKMPERRAADAELERIQSEIDAEVKRTLAGEWAKWRKLRDRDRKLTEQIGGLKDQLLVSQASKEEYLKKRLALERAKDFFKRLGQRKDELDLQSKTQLNNVRIVQGALPRDIPVKPSVVLNLAVGLGGGLLLGLSFGLLREYLDDTISSPLEVSTFLRVPFLGMVPKIEQTNDETDLALFTHENPRSTIAEALRGIRTVLELAPAGGKPLERLLVTSAVSAEGKTSTIVRLGVAFANLNRRVLMVDGDLRKPRIHKIFEQEREPGLTTILDGETTRQEAVKSTPVPNLYFLASGRGGERPNERLASPAFSKLLDELQEEFDLILIDSPPSVLLSDARLLSRYVDGVVLLVREHTTSRVLVREAIQGLEQVGAAVFGVVVNAVDFGRSRTSYKYSYGYGYRYDRYYDDGAEDEPATPAATD